MRESRSHGAAPQDIDFLPASFHQSRQRRRKAVWRRVLLGVSLTLIVLGTVRQHQIRRDRLVTLDESRRQAAALKDTLGDPAALQARIDRLDLRANLIARLRIRIAPTRLLAGVSATRPEFVSFDEFRMTREAVTNGDSAAPASIPAPATPEAAAPPEQRDLDRLARQANESAMFLHLSGVAPDDVTLSRYLIELEGTKLFDEVKLLYTDEHRHGEFRLRNFRLRLRVRRPGESMPRLMKTGQTREAYPLHGNSRNEAILETIRPSDLRRRRFTTQPRVARAASAPWVMAASSARTLKGFHFRRSRSARSCATLSGSNRACWSPTQGPLAFARDPGLCRAILSGLKNQHDLLWRLSTSGSAGSAGDLTVERTGTVGRPCRNVSPEGVRA